MLTQDPVLMEMLRYSRTLVTKIDLYEGTKLVAGNIPVIDGSVTASRKGNARRTFDCSIALNAWESLPVDPYKSRVKIRMGLEIRPGVDQTFPQGVFRVDSVRREWTGGLSLSGTSLESYVIDDRFFTPRTPPLGNSTIAAISALILESIPDAIFLVQGTKDKAVGMTAPWERERWEAVTALSDSIDAETYCNGEGVFVIANKPSLDVASQVPVWKVNAGPDGVLISESLNLTRNKVYNAVVASGQSSDQDVPPVWDVATDDDPNSPTWWGGPFGHVTRFYANPNFTTKEQCTTAARHMLQEAIVEDREVNFTMLPMRALEPGDVIEVTLMDGTVENHLVDEVTYPFGLSDMSAKTLASKVETAE